jgi:hypothetical protein
MLRFERTKKEKVFYTRACGIGMKSYPAFAVFTVFLFVLVSLVGTTVPLAVSSAAAPNTSSATCPGSSGPCPMGVADFGLNGGSTYSYTAVTFKSTVTFTALNIGAATKGALKNSISIQLNAVADNMFRNGKAGFYWTQDVPFVTQESGGKYLVYALDNIWDFNNGASMSGVTGNLKHDCSSSGIGTKQWFCFSKNQYTETLPFTVTMEMLVGIVNGHSAVEFEFGATGHPMVAFDEITFPGSAPSFPFYLVEYAHVPLATVLLTDAETVICGPGGGSTVHLLSISASFTEQYKATGGAAFKSVPHAYSEGRDTAETSSGVHMSASGTTGKASSGTDNSVQLW